MLLVLRRIGECISPDLFCFVNLTSSCSLNLFVQQNFLSCCFTSTEATYILLGTGRRDGGGGGVVHTNSSSLRPDPQRPKRPSATARTTMFRRWGHQCEATCVLHNLLFKQLCRAVTKTKSPKDQLLRNNSAIRQSVQL